MIKYVIFEKLMLMYYMNPDKCVLNCMCEKGPSGKEPKTIG